MLGSQVTRVSLCPSESKSMIEKKGKSGKIFTELYSQPQQTPLLCPPSTPFHPLYNDLPHVESHLLISLPFCLSTSDPLIFTTVSEEDLSLTFKHGSYPKLPRVLLFAVSIPLAFLLHRSCIESLYWLKKNGNTQQIHKCPWVHAAGVSAVIKLKRFHALDPIAGITQVGHFTFSSWHFHY